MTTALQSGLNSGIDTSVDSGTIVDFYALFGLSRDQSTEIIQSELKKLERDWRAKAQRRKGSMSDKAMELLPQIAAARRTFASDQIRMQYDQALRAGYDQPGQVAEVDWLTRAWNYYFLRDEGAAAVAARKAREQHPDDRMVYVVAAWVTLLTAGDEKDQIRRAKTDADEAFVLDELGEDTADVHHVRAVAYLGLEDYDRGLVSIRRALASASPDEMPHMYLIKSSLHQGKKQYEEMLSAAVDGLEVTSNLIEEDRERLTDNLTAALAGLCYFRGDPQRGLSECDSRAANIHRTRIPQTSKEEALAMLGNLKRVATLEGVKDAEYSRPQYLWRIFGIGVLLVLMHSSIGLLFSTTGNVLLALGIIVIIYAVVQAYRLSVWKDNRKAYLSAQNQLQALQESLPPRIKAILTLKRSVQLVVG